MASFVLIRADRPPPVGPFYDDISMQPSAEMTLLPQQNVLLVLPQQTRSVVVAIDIVTTTLT